MTVKIGSVKSAAHVVGNEEMGITAFVVFRDGHHYTYNEIMNAWGRMHMMIVFADYNPQQNDHPHFTLLGTLDGSRAFTFMDDWVTITSEEEMDDADYRVALLKQLTSGQPPRDVEREMKGE